MKIYKRLDMVGDKNPAKRPEVRKKISKKLLGVKHSKQHKINIGKAGKGKKVWNTGLTKQIDERVRKQAESQKLTWNQPEMILNARKRRAKRIFPTKDTKIEVKIQNFLKQLGIEYFTHQYMKIEHGYQCDILIPSMNLVIECDGDYWHKYPTGNDIDHIRTSELLSKGFKVLRLWEHEIKKLDLNKFKQKIKSPLVV